MITEEQICAWLRDSNLSLNEVAKKISSALTDEQAVIDQQKNRLAWIERYWILSVVVFCLFGFTIGKFA